MYLLAPHCKLNYSPEYSLKKTLSNNQPKLTKEENFISEQIAGLTDLIDLPLIF